MKDYPSGQYPNPSVTEILNSCRSASRKMEEIFKNLSDELGLHPDQFKINSNYSGNVWIEVVLK